MDPEDFVEQQSSGDMATTIAHLYRGEMQRSYTWRTRLDTSTNWAILILSALITWTYSDPHHPHELLLFTLLFIAILLGIEARRFMYYNLWHSRVRALETDYLSRTLDPDIEVTSREWLKLLAEDLRNPHFKIPYWHAVSHRLRRVYVWLFTLTVLLWFGKLAMHPVPAGSFSEVVIRAEFLTISGVVVVPLISSFIVVIFLITITNPHYDEDWDKIFKSKKTMKEWKKKM